MIVSPKGGGGSNRMFHNPAKITPGPVFPSGHFAASQQSSNVLHQMHNNNNSSHQQHLNQPWSNGSAGSSGKINYCVIYFISIQKDSLIMSRILWCTNTQFPQLLVQYLGPPSFNNNSGSFGQSNNSNVSGIFSATAANAVVGVSNNSMAGDLLHLGVGSSAATFSAINQTPAIQHPSQPTGAPSPQKPTPISSTSSTSGQLMGGGPPRQTPLSTHPSLSPSGSSQLTNSTMHQISGGPNSLSSSAGTGDVGYNGTELVMLYDYKV
jgi:hypothetical protein